MYCQKLRNEAVASLYMQKEKKRKSKYTEKSQEVLSVLKTGVQQKIAAEIVGVRPETISEWKSKYPSFKAEIEAIKDGLGSAMVDVTVRHALKTEKDGTPTDQAAKSAQWILENVHSDVISKRQTVEHKGEFRLGALIDSAKISEEDNEDTE